MENKVNLLVKQIAPIITKYNGTFDSCKKLTKAISKKKAFATNMFKLGQVLSVALICGGLFFSSATLVSTLLFAAGVAMFGGTIAFNVVQINKCKKLSTQLGVYLTAAKALESLIRLTIVKELINIKSNIFSNEISEYGLIQQYKISRNCLKQKIESLNAQGNNADFGELYAAELEHAIYDEVLNEIEIRDVESKAKAVAKLKEFGQKRKVLKTENAKQTKPAEQNKNNKQNSTNDLSL